MLEAEVGHGVLFSQLSDFEFATENNVLNFLAIIVQLYYSPLLAINT